jgi:hypothetical protein
MSFDVVSVRPETPDGTPAASNSERRHFRPSKEIEGLRGGVLEYRLAERRDPRSGCAAAAEGSGESGWRSHRPAPWICMPVMGFEAPNASRLNPLSR